MLKWHIEKNIIAELCYCGKNIINPWGFETADSSAFFSLEDGVGYRYKKLLEEYSSNDRANTGKIVTQMKEGKWALELNESISDNLVIRKVEAVTLEDTFFMDFVMRFRFKKAFIEYAEIAGHRHYHQNTNIYYQYPAEQVFLKGQEFDINITILDAITPPKMEPVIYVRDRGDEWIVHVRMIPIEWDKEVIKLCTSWAKTRPLPNWVSRVLLSLPSIKKSLWYRGERSPYESKILRRLLNPSAFGMVKLPEKEKLMWHVKMEVL